MIVIQNDGIKITSQQIEEIYSELIFAKQVEVKSYWIFMNGWTDEKIQMENSTCKHVVYLNLCHFDVS